MSDVYKSPATGRVDETRETRFETSTVETGKRAAKTQNVENALRAVQDAIGAVNVATPGRDSSQNGRLRYERNYDAMRKAIRNYVLESGHSISAPTYLAPPTKTEQFTNFGPKDFPVDVLGLYSETGGRSPSGGVQPNFADPASDQHQAWLSTQGVPPVADDVAKTPDQNQAARRKRAGVPS